MKDINFVDSIPASKQKEARIWVFLLLFIFVIGMGILIAVHTMQIQYWFAKHKEQKQLQPKLNQFNAQTAKQAQLSEQKQQLAAKLDKNKQKIERAKNPLDHMQTIVAACAHSEIQSLSLHKKTLNLNGSCNSPQHALEIVHHLNKSDHFNHATLVSVQPQNAYHTKHSYLFHVKAQVVRGELL